MIKDKSIYDRLSEERKHLQQIGELPDFVTTAGWQLLKERYLLPDETLRSRYKEISLAASRHMLLDSKEWEERFFNLLWNGWLSPSTPILSSMGRKDFSGCPVACSGNYVGDSIYDFYDSQTETAMLTKNGFGTSSYLGDIRPRGSEVSYMKGKASGVLPVFKDYIQLANDVSQGSSRRGAWAGYIPIDHDDFYEVTDYIKKMPDDFNIGWCVSDKFIDRLNVGDSEAISRYQRALKLKMITGKGYFLFTDKVNKLNPTWYKDKGIEVKASNLCVVPETKVLTDCGYIPIIDLVDQEVNVWNGQEFSKSLVKQTGSNQKILKVITSHGQELETTEYHKWYRLKGYSLGYEKVSTVDLKSGDKLIKFELPLIEGDKVLDNAYQNGFYSGDGCCSKGVSLVYFYGEKKKLTFMFKDIKGTWSEQEDQDRIVLRTKDLKDKFFVPLDFYDIESRLNWLAGICDSDGTVSRSGTNESLQIGSINKSFLLDIQEMLQTLGITSRINIGRFEGYNQLPANDGTGLNKEYSTQQFYRLLINSNSLYKLLNLGLKLHRLKVNVREPQREAMSYNTVVEIRDDGRYSDTYCFNEPIRHMGMFGGILTGNCTEITLPANEDETFTCVLSSMNISKFDEWKDTPAVYEAIVFLNCVAYEFIDLGSEIKGLEKAVLFTKNHMALGLGALGFHTYLQNKLLPFDSLDAHLANIRIFKYIQSQATMASMDLVEIFGECPITAGYGIANSHLTAIAPNLSTALICGGVSQGIEPIYKNAYIQNTAGGKVTRINPSLLILIQERGLDADEAIAEIIMSNGSVQNVSWLNELEKEVFLTAFEIDQMAILRLAAARQKYISQAQSINLFFSAEESEEYISKVHEEAFINPFIKSLYYIRSETGIKAKSPEEMVCSSCEG